MNPEGQEEYRAKRNPHRSTWTDDVSRQARSTLTEDKWNRNDLPLTDLLLLQKHLTAEIEVGVRGLRDAPTGENHRVQSEATLARVLLCDQRRQGEI